MRIWLVRVLIAIVTAWNIQAAIDFIFSPELFVHAYELSGVAGEAAVRGVGVLFLMWNIPYLFAIIDPIRFRLGVLLALLMQATGLIGECYIFSTLPRDHEVLRSSIIRFVEFDGAGFVLLVMAWLLLWKRNPPDN